MSSTGAEGRRLDAARRLTRLEESIQRHEEAIDTERRVVVAAVARIAERRVRLEQLRQLKDRLRGRDDEG